MSKAHGRGWRGGQGLGIAEVRQRAGEWGAKASGECVEALTKLLLRPWTSATCGSALGSAWVAVMKFAFPMCRFLLQKWPWGWGMQRRLDPCS